LLTWRINSTDICDVNNDPDKSSQSYTCVTSVHDLLCNHCMLKRHAVVI